ncbi:hypothetical protein TNCV_3735801 [Trichonephila clavipes]|nr:hypothetical protein TNCV_3735801 [Trichonephila clavipes]
MSTVYHTVGGTNACCFQSRVNEAMDALRTFHFAANGVELYEKTQNAAEQTESAVLLFVMWLSDPSLLCAQSVCHHGQ